MDNRQTLIELMQQYELSRKEIAVMIGVSMRTIGNWLQIPASPEHRRCPDMAIRLIKCAMREQGREINGR